MIMYYVGVGGWASAGVGGWAWVGERGQVWVWVGALQFRSVGLSLSANLLVSMVGVACV